VAGQLAFVFHLQRRLIRWATSIHLGNMAILHSVTITASPWTSRGWFSDAVHFSVNVYWIWKLIGGLHRPEASDRLKPDPYFLWGGLIKSNWWFWIVPVNPWTLAKAFITSLSNNCQLIEYRTVVLSKAVDRMALRVSFFSGFGQV